MAAKWFWFTWLKVEPYFWHYLFCLAKSTIKRTKMELAKTGTHLMDFLNLKYVKNLKWRVENWVQFHHCSGPKNKCNFQPLCFGCSKFNFPQVIIVWVKSIFVYLVVSQAAVHFLSHLLMRQRGFVTCWWPEKRNKERRPPSQKMYFKICKKHSSGDWNSPQMSHAHFWCLARKFK